jgi:DNA primase
MDSSNNQIEEIKDRLDIVNVVEKYVKLKRTGKNYIGLCPFHTEKTPSFVVSPDIQRYKCFGCGETGDIFNFLQDIESIDFPEALEKLAKEAGVELKKSPYNSKYRVLEEINYKATKYFYNQFKKNSKAQKYMKERGFTEASLKTFGVGYAPKNPKLREYLAKSKNYTQRELLDSGLFTLKEKKIKEKFYDRIMFPIRSKRGKVLAFTARVLPGNNWGPKYMNSPDTPIFHKKENLFGQYESRQEIRKSDLAIVCEGSTDVIAAHQHGVKNIVAPLGTGLTREQLKNLSKITKNFLFFFDSDDAGKNALIRGFKLASELKLVPYITSPEPYKDIDELLQEKPKRMKSLVKNKREAFFFILEDYLANKNLNKLEDLNRVRNFIGSLLSSVKDSDVKKYYSRKAATITKINSLRPSSGKNSNVTEQNVTKNIPVKEADNKLYREYLQRLLLLENIKDEYLLDEKAFEPVNSPSLKRTYKEILTHYKKGREEMYFQLHDNTQIAETFEKIIFDLTNIPTDKKTVVTQLEDIKKKIEINNLKAKQKDLSVKVALAEEGGKSKKAEEYLKELIAINKVIKEKENA